jgi:hypothetical protein
MLFNKASSITSRLFARQTIYVKGSRPFSMHSYTATKPGGGQVIRPLSPHLTVYVFKENSELYSSYRLSQAT